MASTSKVFVRRAGAFIRHLWFSIGIALLIFVGAELMYRGQASVRRTLRSVPEQQKLPPHPYQGEPWWSEWQNGGAVWEMRFDPYRALWARPGRSKYVNIDSFGRRLTVDPAPEVPKTAAVFMFGGSAMFGYTARDSETIPSLVAAELARRGHAGVSVLNYAQSASNMTQGVNALVLELRSRNVPSVAVFMDGNNEVAPPFQSGRVGSILNEDFLARRLTGPQRGAADVLMDHLQLAQRIRAVSQRPPDPYVGGPDLCPDIAAQYTALTDIVHGLGREFQFHTLFFWQPMYATTGKRQTEWEQSIASAGDAIGGERWRSTVRECTRAVKEAVIVRGVDDFYPLDRLFDGETETVFIDDYGHIVESANGVVASTIADRILERLPLPTRPQ